MLEAENNNQWNPVVDKETSDKYTIADVPYEWKPRPTLQRNLKAAIYNICCCVTDDALMSRQTQVRDIKVKTNKPYGISMDPWKKFQLLVVEQQNGKMPP